MFAQCQFLAEPIAITNWYRSEGWHAPGVSDGQATRPLNVTINGKRPGWPTGVTVSEIVHTKDYRVIFPAAVFQENGKRKKMRPRKLVLRELLRWDINDKPFAYSYDLAPEGVLCTFSVDLVDDKGDGVLRVMVAPGHVSSLDLQPPPLPGWVKALMSNST